MSDKTCLGAYTAPEGTYPAFVNVSADSSTVTLMVRGPARTIVNHKGTFPITGEFGVIEMPRDEFEKLWKGVGDELAKYVRS
jgi:hypothetical protein